MKEIFLNKIFFHFYHLGVLIESTLTNRFIFINLGKTLRTSVKCIASLQANSDFIFFALLKFDNITKENKREFFINEATTCRKLCFYTFFKVFLQYFIKIIFK